LQETAVQRSRRLISFGLPLILSAVAIFNAGPARAADADSEDRLAVDAPQDIARATDSGRQEPTAFAQKRLAKLKSALRITPEQEAQWSAFSDTVLMQMEQWKASHQQEQSAPVSAPERIDRQIERMRRSVTTFEVVGQAAKDLYAALGPDQRKIADEKLLRWHGRRGESGRS